MSEINEARGGLGVDVQWATVRNACAPKSLHCQQAVHHVQISCCNLSFFFTDSYQEALNTATTFETTHY
jgi:hypothetical protein